MLLWFAIQRSAIAGLALIALNAPDIRAQPTPTARPQFDVISIKPHPPSDGPPRTSMSAEHGRIAYTAVTVRACIRKAYGLKIYPLSGGPDALSMDRYDIFAKGSSDASEQRTMLMLQALLEERFKLALHRETKELPMYALVVGKGGPKFREVQDDGSAAEIGSGEGHRLKAHHISMKALAGTLQGYVGETVVDTTGLTGLFDFNLDFTVDESLAADATSGPTLFDAVQQQLGLKLESRKGPVEVVIVDHVEKPSGN